MEGILEMGHWSWVILGLGMLVFELIVPFMFFLWLGVSALVTGAVLFVFPDMGWQAQFLLFSVLSVASILISRKYFFHRAIETDLPNLNRRGQQYVGRVFTLIEPISNGYGKISVDDSQWRVRGPSMEKGESVKVVAINGTVFDVEAADLSTTG